MTLSFQAEKLHVSMDQCTNVRKYWCLYDNAPMLKQSKCLQISNIGSWHQHIQVSIGYLLLSVFTLHCNSYSFSVNATQNSA